MDATPSFGVSMKHISQLPSNPQLTLENSKKFTGNSYTEIVNIFVRPPTFQKQRIEIINHSLTLKFRRVKQPTSSIYH